MTSTRSALAPVLVVDDDVVAAHLAVKTLEHAHLANPVVHLPSGDEAVDYLAGGGEWPVLILLDVEMPGRSGVDVLRWLRSEPGLAALPVVMITSSSGPGPIKEAYDLGVDAFLLKPVAFEALVDVVTRLGLSWALFRPESAE